VFADAPDDEAEATRRLVAAFAHALVDDPRRARVTFGEAAGISPAVERQRRKNRRWAAQFVESLWSRYGAAPGRAGVDPHRIAIGMIGGHVRHGRGLAPRRGPGRSGRRRAADRRPSQRSTTSCATGWPARPHERGQTPFGKGSDPFRKRVRLVRARPPRAAGRAAAARRRSGTPPRAGATVISVVHSPPRRRTPARPPGRRRGRRTPRRGPRRPADMLRPFTD